MPYACCSVLQEQLLAMFRRYPQLMMEQYREVKDYVCNSRANQEREDFYMHVVSIRSLRQYTMYSVSSYIHRLWEGIMGTV